MTLRQMMWFSTDLIAVTSLTQAIVTSVLVLRAAW